MKSGLLASLLFGFAFSIAYSVDDRIFNFQLPLENTNGTITDLSWLNHKPAGVRGPVHAGPDGHLYAGNERQRFLGVNFTYRSAIPEHSDAEKIAARLARFGINIVRFHLMDANWGGECIFDPAYPGTRHLDPKSLDKLDYFVFQLKKNGIYSDMNLLTGRAFRSFDGLDPSIDSMGWKARQTPAMFDRPMIELQKEYARLLLDRVNPYTELRYTVDPAIAIVELVNEHGLMHAWLAGMVDTLPNYYREELRGMWNSHLHSRYSSHAALADAWQMQSEPGPEMLVNGDFSAGFANWNREQHENAKIQTAVTSQGPEGAPSARISVTSVGSQGWHVQLNQGGLAVSTGTVYTLRFWAKADRNKTITVDIGQAHAPWSGLGFRRSLSLTTEWQPFAFTLTLTGSDSNARVNFGQMGDQIATYWFAGCSLAQGGTIGLFAGESLDNDSVRLFTLDEAPERTGRARGDWMAFLWETEKSYWTELRDYLKDTLGVQALLAGTIVGTSTPNLMNLFDLIDSHAYWQHPSFQGTDWGPNWWIRNSSMVGETDGGTLAGLAMKRIAGKPFSVSEYNHPFPNSFGSEALYFLSVYGCLQDWDALFAYTYADGTLKWNEDRQNGYFDVQHDPGKMISLAQAALIFRTGGVSPAKQLVAASLPAGREKELLVSAGSWRLVDASDLDLPRLAALQYRTALIPEGGSLPPGAVAPFPLPANTDGGYAADTGEIVWNPASRLLVVSSARTKGLIGYPAPGQTYSLGEVAFEPKSSLQGWFTLFMTLIGGGSFTEDARSILLAAHGLVQNTGMSWQYYESRTPAGFPPPAGVNLILGHWGYSPVQAEGVQAEFVVPYRPGRVRVFALDSAGARKTEIPVIEVSGRSQFEISPAYQTLWYEIEIRPRRRRSD
ncbi:MAG: carbohydrate binding domain-containing protein [Acidobacteriota bacterium]